MEPPFLEFKNRALLPPGSMHRFYLFMLAGMAWNHWPESNGIGGRDGME